MLVWADVVVFDMMHSLVHVIVLPPKVRAWCQQYTIYRINRLEWQVQYVYDIILHEVGIRHLVISFILRH